MKGAVPLELSTIAQMTKITARMPINTIDAGVYAPRRTRVASPRSAIIVASSPPPSVGVNVTVSIPVESDAVAAEAIGRRARSAWWRSTMPPATSAGTSWRGMTIIGCRAMNITSRWRSSRMRSTSVSVNRDRISPAR